ncbi:MAG: hypothetical protein ACREU7_16205, partial [Burkholderiales bacterium]
ARPHSAIPSAKFINAPKKDFVNFVNNGDSRKEQNPAKDNRKNVVPEQNSLEKGLTLCIGLKSSVAPRLS